MKERSAKLLAKAERAIDAAARLLEAGHIDFAADRGYYACFYVAEALLADRDLAFSSHGAVHGRYGKEFAKTGQLDPRFHRLLLNAFDKRQVAVYELEAALVEEEVRHLVDEAKDFLATAHAFLEKGGP